MRKKGKKGKKGKCAVQNVPKKFLQIGSFHDIRSYRLAFTWRSVVVENVSHSHLFSLPGTSRELQLRIERRSVRGGLFLFMKYFTVLPNPSVPMQTKKNASLTRYLVLAPAYISRTLT
jgi:hypothetical protein